MPDAKRAELIESGARAEDLPPYDPDEFPEVALAASAVEPEMTLEGAQKLHRFLNYQQWGRLFAAVRSVNIADRDIPFSVTAYALTLASPSKPEQPEPTESPGPS
jgi:hypothetical protein